MAAGEGPVHLGAPPPPGTATSMTSPNRVRTAGAGAGTGGTRTATRRRAKSFLRNYYGIQQADPATQDGPKDNSSSQSGQVTKIDPYDLDSHSFEVDKYMHKLFVEKQLPGLVKADNDLVADIRQLDGDMKTLVYENYSKFLSATDTINKMKSNVDNLESEMSRLTQNISQIASSSAAIHSSLGSKREKIHQLNGVHSLLTKLQFVFELPTNLHQCLEAESYTQAVKSYCRTLHLLQHYKNLTVFTGIERECKAIMVQIAQKIRQNMCSEQATMAEILECVGLLLALKEDPVALWKQCLELCMNCLRKLKSRTMEDIKSLPLYTPPAVTPPKSAQTSASAASKRASKRISKTPISSNTTSGIVSTPKDRESTSETNTSTQPQDKVSYLNAYFLKQVEGFVVSFRNYFLIPAAGSAEESTTVDQRPPAWITKDARVYASLTGEELAEAAVSVKSAASKAVSQYLDTISSFLEYPEDIFSIKPEVHVHVLQNLYLATVSSNGLCQLVGFDALATGLIQNWEGRLIDLSLKRMKDGLMAKVAEQETSLGQSKNMLDITASTPTEPNTATMSTDVLKETTQWLVDVFRKDTIPFLEKCLSSDAQFLETTEGRSLFLKNIQNGFKKFWELVLMEMKERSTFSQPIDSTSSRTSSLVMSQLCFELSDSVVEQLYKILSKTVFRPGKRTRSGSFIIESYDEPPVIPQLQWDCKAIVQSCQESGHQLLDGFIARTGNELSWLLMNVQSTTLDFMSLESPPKGVSEAWEEIYRQLNDIERQVITVYGDEGDRLGNHEISSESIRRESVFRPAGGSNNGNGTRLSHRNESLASFGSNTMNSRFEHQQRNLLLSNIDKLFSDRVEIFIRCQDLNRTGIMFGVIKILLKAWAESVRTMTFGKGGFQQVQVDAEFAKVWLWRFATADERLMHSLLEETQQTAYRRCTDAMPLDLNTVESIINSSER